MPQPSYLDLNEKWCQNRVATLEPSHIDFASLNKVLICEFRGSAMFAKSNVRFPHSDPAEA